MTTCLSCGERIDFERTAAGKRTPVNRDGTCHFKTCPKARSWRGTSRIKRMNDLIDFENGMIEPDPSLGQKAR